MPGAEVNKHSVPSLYMTDFLYSKSTRKNCILELYKSDLCEA